MDLPTLGIYFYSFFGPIYIYIYIYICYIYIYIYIYLYIYICACVFVCVIVIVVRDGHEFRTWIQLFVIHIALVLLGNV